MRAMHLQLEQFRAPRPVLNQPSAPAAGDSPTIPCSSADDDAVPAQPLIGLTSGGGVKGDGGAVALRVETMRAIAGLDWKMPVQGARLLRRCDDAAGERRIGLRSPKSAVRQGIASRRRHVAPALLLC
jgi:hypothetical protein